MKVSIITPAFNSSATIARCIESVKSQDYIDIEHIIIDGGSSDGSVEFLQQSGVSYISEPDAGIYHAMNKGVRMAQGNVIHILNSDDWYSANDVISTMVDFMASGEYDICHGYVMHVNTKGDDVLQVGGDINQEQLFQNMKVAHPSCFVRSSVYHRYGDFSSGFRIAADYDFLLRIWSKVNVGFIPRCIVKMQIGGASISNPLRTYKEFLAVALVHGKGVLPALLNFYLGYVKHYLALLLRKYSYKK